MSNVAEQSTFCGGVIHSMKYYSFEILIEKEQNEHLVHVEKLTVGVPA